MRVLITGAGGFIGRHLVADQLRCGREVTAVDLNVEALRPLAPDSKLEVVQGDFTDPALLDGRLAGHDVCYHLASAHLETGVADAYFYRVNVAGTRAFAERCHQAGVGRFVHCSTVGVYGDIKHRPADEESPCHPDVAYEKSKLAGERAVREFARASGLDVVVVRPAWVYGPGCPRTAKLFRTIGNGRFFYVGDGQSLRHPIFIADMVAGFELAAVHPAASGETFIMAGPRPVTLRELAASIAALQQVSPPRLQLPAGLVWAGCYALELGFGLVGRPAPFTRRSLKFFTGNTAFSTAKAVRMLGFQPRVSLDEGLALTHAWLQSASG
jgi:nucleoside-diphosphate-sugar epimerase